MQTLENWVCYCYTSYEMTDRFFWFHVQMNSYSSNWNRPYKRLIVTAAEFQNAIWTWGHLRRTICNKFCFKLGKNAKETSGMLQTVFRSSCMNRASVFEWHMRFKEGRESVGDDERCGRSREVNTPELIGQRVRVRIKVTMLRFKGVQEETPLEEVSTLQIGSMTFPAGQLILVTDYLSRMGIKTVTQPPYSPDFAPCDFCLFPKLRGCRYETVEEMKEAVTNVIDPFTQADFHGVVQKLLER